MSRTKIVVLVLVAVALIVAVGWGLRPRPLAVETALVDRGTVQVTIEEDARTRIRETYTVASPITGFVRRVEVEVGQPVRAGAVLAVVEPPPSPPLDARTQAEAVARAEAARAALSRSRREVEAAAAQATLARRERDRMAPLAVDSIISRLELDRYVAAVQQAEAGEAAAASAARSAQAQLAGAQATLAVGGRSPRAAITVTAPVTGVVLAIHHESEGAVAAGQPLVEVGDPDDLAIVADVLTQDAVRLIPETRVLVSGWGGQAVLEGRVERVEPVAFTDVTALGVEEQRARVVIAFNAAAWAEGAVDLGDGYRVTAQFVLRETDNATRAPESALFREGAGWGAFVVVDGRAVRRRVEVGHRDGVMTEVLGDGVWAEVTAGLSPGERVVLHPAEGLADGIRVAVADR